jgi:hypothetical protein
MGNDLTCRCLETEADVVNAERRDVPDVVPGYIAVEMLVIAMRKI